MRGGPNDNTLKPKIIKIKREMSKPRDFDAPSLLATFPAEIMNAVYQVFFRCERLIEVVSPKEHRAAPAWYFNREVDSNWGEEEKREMMWSIGEYRKRILYDFEPGIALLTVSRRVYHRTTRILYAGN